MVNYNRTPSVSIYEAWPRWVNLLIGIWLVVSAFAWPHAAGAQANTWILGILIAIVSFLAMFAPGARYLNTALAVWLFFSTLVIHYVSAATFWNNLIAAIVVFALSLLPNQPQTAGPGGQRPIHA